jgi:hypothetical protein
MSFTSHVTPFIDRAPASPSCLALWSLLVVACLLVLLLLLLLPSLWLLTAPVFRHPPLHHRTIHQQIYGHQKFKVGAIRSYGNVLAYVYEFGGGWGSPGTIPDEPNEMFDNQVGQGHRVSTWGGWYVKRLHDCALD